MKSRTVHRRTKIRIYKTIIKTTLWYGCETWVLSKASMRMMNTFERKDLRRIFGAIRMEEKWRTRHNAEVYELYEDPPISTQIKLRKLQWAEHVQKMEPDRIPKRALESGMEGRRPIGKPWTHWIDSIDMDSRALLQRSNWRTVARDRDK